MEKQSWKYTALLTVPFLLFACQKPAPVAAKHADAAEMAVPPGDPVPQERVADDTARFLAGMAGKPGSPYLPLEEDAAWKEHQRQMDAAWASADEKLIRGLREFQKSELSNPAVARNVLFYPFSGPDALTETLSFPHSPTYVMVALEPAGTLPAEARLGTKDLPRYLAEVRTTLASELGKSFFVTREMDRQFRGQITDGLVVPTLILLVRTGHSILGLKYVRVDEEGKVADRQGGVPVQAEHANKGFELEFRTDEDGSAHRLYYFSLNLADKRLKANTGFLKYVDSLPAHTTLLKATSYMTHHPEFSTIRQIVVEHSAAVFQDDSGIPYRYFTPGQWNVQLYGEYKQPYGSFRYMEQADLRKAYQTGTVRPLSLRLGYGFGKVTSNLLLATRTGK